jgi:hypothetical protein
MGEILPMACVVLNMAVLEGKPVAQLLEVKVLNMRTRKAKQHKMLKLNIKTELLQGHNLIK